MPNRFSIGCGCCGNGLDPADCSNGCDFSVAEITSLTITNSTTPETWTQSGSSTYFGAGIIDVPTTSSISGSPTWRFTYNGAKFNPAAWTIAASGIATLQSDSTWKCGDGSITIEKSGDTAWTGSCTVVDDIPCGCCLECPYNDDAITSLSVDEGGGFTATQSGPSAFRLLPLATPYCVWLVPVTGSAYGSLYRVTRDYDTGVGDYRWRVQDDPFLFLNYVGYMTACSGNVSTSFSGRTATFTVTSAGNCPDGP